MQQIWLISANTCIVALNIGVNSKKTGFFKTAKIY